MSDIDYSKLRQITARELLKAIEKDGFIFKNQKGSHKRYIHKDGRRVTLPYHHSSQTYPIKTLKSIIESHAQWNHEDLLRLNLVDD